MGKTKQRTDKQEKNSEQDKKDSEKREEDKETKKGDNKGTNNPRLVTETVITSDVVLTLLVAFLSAMVLFLLCALFKRRQIECAFYCTDRPDSDDSANGHFQGKLVLAKSVDFTSNHFSFPEYALFGISYHAVQIYSVK